MQFLKNLFGITRANPRAKKAQPRKELQLLNMNDPHPQHQQLGKDMEHPQQKNLKLTTQTQPSFLSPQQPCLLQPRFIQLNGLFEGEDSLEIDEAMLVGLINKPNLKEDMLEGCLQIQIGTNQEINSLGSMRRYCLDKLVIFWTDRESQFTMDQIVQARQRFVFVFDDQEAAKKIVKTYQSCLLQRFGDKLLAQSSDKLLFNLIRLKHFFIVQFQDQKKFTKKFITRIKTAFPFLADLQQLEELIAMMTLEDYLLSLESAVKIETKMMLFKQAIEKQVLEKKKKQQLRRIDEMLAAEVEQSGDPLPEPIRKNSSMEAEIEAEYFGKRESQKENRESQKQTRESGSKRFEQEELYYFIEEHEESNSSNEYSCTDQQPTINSANRPSNSPPRIGRSKSWNSLAEAKEQEIDEEFFSKY